MRIKNIEISPDEILQNEIIIDDIPFQRYYHHNKNPTRYFASRYGQVYSEISHVIMKPTTNKNGYYVLGLRFKNKGKPKYVQVHQIIATVFCGGYHKKRVVDHIDGDKKNNNADNLEWVTSSINSKRAYDKGLHKKYFGDENANNIYSDKLIHQACSYLQEGKSVKETHKLTNISISVIHGLISGKARTNITKEYKFPDSLYNGPHDPLDAETKEEIINLYNSGIPMKQIQKLLNISTLSRVTHAIYDQRYNK